MADFEFETGIGERPVPVCLVAKELRSGRTYRIFQDEFGPTPPYATGPDVLFVAYYASAECGCYRALGWPMPERILDLFCEFRDRTNGLSTPAGAGLLGALTYFGLDGMAATEKREIQQAIGTGTWRGRYSPEEILDYCAAILMRWKDCWRRCCRRSICPVHYCAVVTWPLLPLQSSMARRSISTR
jgi:hypothetical protein